MSPPSVEDRGVATGCMDWGGCMSTPLLPDIASPSLLTRGSAPGPRWGSAPRPRYRLTLRTRAMRVHPDLVTPLLEERVCPIR